MTEPLKPYDPNPRAHPGLRAIALVEAIKGLLALLAASGLELLGPAPLRRAVHALIHRFQVSPDEGALAWLSQAINPDAVHLAAAVAGAYGLLHLLEAWGLWRDRAWASWLGCAAAAVYLPFELAELGRRPSVPTAAVLGLNLVVVWVLGRDVRKRRASSIA